LKKRQIAGIEGKKTNFGRWLQVGYKKQKTQKEEKRYCWLERRIGGATEVVLIMAAQG
jgi:hypothetical protein